MAHYNGNCDFKHAIEHDSRSVLGLIMTYSVSISFLPDTTIQITGRPYFGALDPLVIAQLLSKYEL